MSCTCGDFSPLLESACQLKIDDPNNVLKTISNLYYEKQMCDVILVVGKKEHHAHRLILCAYSDVFQAMLMRPEWSEWHESRIQLQEFSECEHVFDNFLKYMYTGQILITHTNVKPLLVLADKYNVKSLTRVCLVYMSKHIVHAACYNQLFSWLQYVIPCGHTEIAKQCQNYIKWNLESVADTPDFQHFELDMLVELLKQHDVVIYNELRLFHCIVRWLDLQEVRWRKANMPESELDLHIKHLVEVVMCYVRFPMMTPRELADLLLNPLVRVHKDFIIERMTVGMIYHSGNREQMHQLMEDEESRLQFIPRHYTSDTFSTTIFVKNVHNLPSYHTSTFVFSTHLSSAEYDSDRVIEWVADFYPKGVWFQKCNLIVWQGTLEIPEEILRTVRLSLTCREQPKDDLRAHVAVLIYHKEGETEYVANVVERVHHFNCQNRILNIDDLLPFEELNPPVSLDEDNRNSDSLRDSEIKLNIIITPTTAYCQKGIANPRGDT